MSLDDAAKIVSAELSTQPAKAKLLERIKDDSSLKVPVPSAKLAAGQRKLKIRELILKRQIAPNPDPQCLKDMLAMIRTLDRDELDGAFVKNQLEKWFNKHYAKGESGVNHEMRRAVCYVDWRLNRPESTAAEKGTGKQ